MSDLEEDWGNDANLIDDFYDTPAKDEEENGKRKTDNDELNPQAKFAKLTEADFDNEGDEFGEADTPQPSELGTGTEGYGTDSKTANVNAKVRSKPRIELNFHAKSNNDTDDDDDDDEFVGDGDGDDNALDDEDDDFDDALSLSSVAASSLSTGTAATTKTKQHQQQPATATSTSKTTASASTPAAVPKIDILGDDAELDAAQTPGGAASRAHTSALSADPLQHQNTARHDITIAAAYATGGAPAYSKRSNRPYVAEKMAADIPALISDHSLIQTLFQTTAPLPLPLHSLLDAATAEADDPETLQKLYTNPTRTLLSATHKIASHLAIVSTTTGPLPPTIMETSCLLTAPQNPTWLPSEIEALDKGLELYGKNFTRISRECVQSKTTFECIHAYYTRKHDLRSVKVKKYKKKVGKEDEEYVKYVGGLGKYIAMETKRMKAEKVGTNNNNSNNNKSYMAAVTSTSASYSSSSGLNNGVDGFDGPVKVGAEIKGLMGSIKDLTELGVGSGTGVFPAGGANASTNNGAVSLANVIADESGGRSVRTRRSAAS
ncbi:UNVERIFIED_CONTAM: hypothetical protein HDU68_011841 [Siphonaria sp. JEL0065]|nr:hypothetical protein HDU68_011841 [Siphonaria sp. JEL0065]